MSTQHDLDRDDLRTELAAAAARLIAEDGLDYASAKRKAVAQVLGSGGRSAMPDNSAIEAELRRYLQTFVPEHREALRRQRQLALELMRRLERFDPHLTGAVLNGTATGYSDIHLQLFVDSAKDVEMFLLDQRIDFEVLDGSQEPGGALETICFAVRPPGAAASAQVGVVLDVLDADAIRTAPKGRSGAVEGLHPVEASGRANAAMLAQLIDES